MSGWMAKIPFKSRLYWSAQTWVSVRVSINCTFRRNRVPLHRTLPFQDVRNKEATWNGLNAG